MNYSPVKTRYIIYDTNFTIIMDNIALTFLKHVDYLVTGSLDGMLQYRTITSNFNTAKRVKIADALFPKHQNVTSPNYQPKLKLAYIIN